jgi:hypothetical protein
MGDIIPSLPPGDNEALMEALDRAFFVFLWESRAAITMRAFQGFLALLNDSDLIEELFTAKAPNVEAIRHLVDQEQLEFQTTLAFTFATLFGEGAKEAIPAIYMRQMIVLITAYVEGMLVEFSNCLFIRHPMRMYAYLASGQDVGQKGKVDLRELVDAASKEELLHRLAKRAAKALNEGSFDKALKKLQELADFRLEPALVDRLKGIVEQRNRIIHEVLEEDVTKDRVVVGFEVFEQLLSSLYDMAVHNDVPCMGHPLYGHIYTFGWDELETPKRWQPAMQRSQRRTKPVPHRR